MGIEQYIKIGPKIKEFRIAKGIKQKDMADELGVNVSTYSNYENGYREPKLDLIHSICKILGTNIDELLGISQLDPLIAEKIYDYLISDDVKLVKKELINAFQKLVLGKILTENDIEDLKIFLSSTYVQEILNDWHETTYTKKLKIDRHSPLNSAILTLRNGGTPSQEEQQALDDFIQSGGFQHAFDSFSDSMKKFAEHLKEYYDLLNEEGQKKADKHIEYATEQIEMLTRIPGYRKED